MKFSVRELSVGKNEFGPEYVYEVFDPKDYHVVGWCVIDNTARSPVGVGKGGTAMYPTCDLEITRTKARVMTWKQVFCVPMGNSSRYAPWGGAKGGIRYDSSRSDAEQVLRAWARALYEAGVIPDQYIFGLDVGLKEWATRAVVEELGSSKVSTGKPKDIGGIPYDELGVTGYGIALAMDLMAQARKIDIRSPHTTIAIQGFGAVGHGTAQWLEKLYPGGARVVMASDKCGTFRCETGLSADEYRNLFSRPEAFHEGNVPQDVSKFPIGTELFMPVDMLVLAYKEDQITVDNVGKIRAKVVVEGANRGVTDDAEQILHRRGILSLTDFTINCGASSIVYTEHAGGSIEEGMDYVKEVITTNVDYLLNEEKTGTYSPRECAEEIAKSEVRKAMRERK